MNDLFRKFAHKVSELVGSPWMFLLACFLVVAWGVGGVMNGFTDTWQLIINTLTTILTFLIVFLIQNTQNRDAKALHLKLDELLRAVHHARNTFVDLEELSDEDLDKLEGEFRHIHQIAERVRAVSARRRENKN